MGDKKKREVTNQGVSQFLSKVATTPVRKANAEQGRLMFAMDATASREPTWDHACHLQGEMFKPFDINSAHELKQLLSAVAVFAAGGRQALEDYSQRSGVTIQRLNR